MKKINSLPVLLKNPRILLIGGGNVALEKAAVLAKNNIEYRVVSNEIKEELNEYCSDIKIKNIESEDLEGFDFIVDATGNDEVRKLLLSEKEKRFFMLNRVDIPEDCDFYFSSLLQYANLKIAVSSDGASPTLTQLVRNRIVNLLPPILEDIAAQKLREREAGYINKIETREQINKALGEVTLVGCGPGDPELLTIKALNAIRFAEVVLYDNLISDEILKLVPENAIKIFVGKVGRSHQVQQEETNRLLLEYVNAGYRVARLKNGDPFVFGRGSEEVEYLIENGIKVSVIPGISSAIGGPLSAGIPVTAREISSGFSVVSGCLKGGETNNNWYELLKIKNHTVVVLMGLTCVEEIVENALGIGAEPEMPAAIISKASLPDQKVIVTTIKNLPAESKNAERPALLVFGEVVHKAVTINEHLEIRF